MEAGPIMLHRLYHRDIGLALCREQSTDQKTSPFISGVAFGAAHSMSLNRSHKSEERKRPSPSS